VTHIDPDQVVLIDETWSKNDKNRHDGDACLGPRCRREAPPRPPVGDRSPPSNRRGAVTFAAACVDRSESAQIGLFKVQKMDPRRSRTNRRQSLETRPPNPPPVEKSECRNDFKHGAYHDTRHRNLFEVVCGFALRGQIRINGSATPPPTPPSDYPPNQPQRMQQRLALNFFDLDLISAW